MYPVYVIILNQKVILETWNNTLRGIYHSLSRMAYIFLQRDHIKKMISPRLNHIYQSTF